MSFEFSQCSKQLFTNIDRLIVILLFRLKLSIEFAVKIYPEVLGILSGLGEGSDGPDSDAMNLDSGASDENGSDDLDSEASESSFKDADSTRDSWKAAILADRMLKKCGAHIPSCDIPAQVPMFDQDGKSKGHVCQTLCCKITVVIIALGLCAFPMPRAAGIFRSSSAHGNLKRIRPITVQFSKLFSRHVHGQALR